MLDRNWNSSLICNNLTQWWFTFETLKQERLYNRKKLITLANREKLLTFPYKRTKVEARNKGFVQNKSEISQLFWRKRNTK